MSDRFDAIKKMRNTEDIESNYRGIEGKEEIPDDQVNRMTDSSDDSKQTQDPTKVEEKLAKIKGEFKLNNTKIIYVLSCIILIGAFFIIKSDFLTGKFQIYSKNGELYRLNKINGQLSLINDTRLVAIDEPNKLKELGLNKLKEWDKVHIAQLDGLDFDLKTNWRSNKVYYQLQVSPYTKRLKNIRDGNDISSLYKAFTIKLQDENGFDILKITVPIGEMTGATDEKNKIYGLSKNDSVECNYDDFKAIKTWTVEWNL